MAYPVECLRCGAIGEHDVIDPLLPDPGHVAYACPDCGAVHRGEA